MDARPAPGSQLLRRLQAALYPPTPASVSRSTRLFYINNNRRQHRDTARLGQPPGRLRSSATMLGGRAPLRPATLSAPVHVASLQKGASDTTRSPRPPQ